MPFSLCLSFYVTSNVEFDRPEIHVLRTVDSNAQELNLPYLGQKGECDRERAWGQLVTVTREV